MSDALGDDVFSVPMIFCRVGWMERYQGLASDDAISGGGDYVHQHGFGHEIMNFLPFEGRVYGFVQRTNRNGSEFDATMNLQRLGGSPPDDAVSNVLAVWVATHPDGGARVVGWYRNAMIHRRWQAPPQGSNRTHEGSPLGYFISAAAEDAVLIPVDERTFDVPQRGSGNFGQSNAWYADVPDLHQMFRRQLLDYVAGVAPTHSAGAPTQPDPLKRVEVEKAAVLCVSDYYRSHGYTVESFEEDNRGWDLEARRGATLLRVEVKGLSGPMVCAEVTPNEYRAMQAHKSTYRLCIVTSALTKPSLKVFAFSAESQNWLSQEGSKLQIEEIVAARCSCI